MGAIDRRPLAFVLGCLLFAGGCSAIHRDDPKHTWLPLTHRTYDGRACCSGNCGMHPDVPECKTGQQQFSAMGADLLLPFAFIADALALPFHALGHLFARRQPQSPPASGS